jgi:hypothetical protein
VPEFGTVPLPFAVFAIANLLEPLKAFVGAAPGQ